MENGYASVREIEKYCKTDIRYMWLLQDNPPPSHMTIDNFMNKTMLENIDRIFADVNEYIFQKEQVDLNHVYIDGTKISANAGKYSRVWKKSCEKNRIKLFAKITELLENMNAGTALLGVKFLRNILNLSVSTPEKPFTERGITKLLNSGSLKSFPSISKG